MKKFCALLVLFLLWTTPIVSQTKTDKDREGLIGPVKQVESAFIDFFTNDGRIVELKRGNWYHTTYNTEGNISEKTTYDQSGIVDRLVYTYDANGRSTGFDEYPASLDKALKTPRHHVYTFNEEGRKVEYTVSESNGSVGQRYVYKYDAKGNLIEQQWYGHTGKLGGRLVYTFDERGNQTSEASHLPDGGVDWKQISKYDANGNRTERLQYQGSTLKYKVLFSYDSKGRILETDTAEFTTPSSFPSHFPVPGKVVYTYDDQKRTKEIATYDAGGKLRHKVVYTHDERENEIGRTVFDPDGAVRTNDTLTIDIEYDSHGNWTRKTRFILYEKGKQPQAAYAEVRVITYY